MPIVYIPPPLRSLSGGARQLAVDGRTVGELVDALDAQFPGVRSRLCAGDDVMPGLTVAVDARISTLGLLERVADDSEVHFLPSVGGG